MTRRYCSTCRRTFAVDTVCPADETPLKPLATDYPQPGDAFDQAAVYSAHLADGGMSKVFTVMSADESGGIAVKILKPSFANDAPAVERYYREARMNLLLDHPNVVDVLHYGLTEEGHHAISMELLGGASLGQVLHDEAWLPWERAVHIAIEVADALGHAHGRRVIHRDIKPDNVQLLGEPGPEEQVKLLDFGVAYYAADVKFSGPAPGSAGVSGTPAYMSPEQIQALPLDGRSDLYALGILLFEMLSGTLPFDGDDPVTMCRHQLYTKPPSLGDRIPVDSDVPLPLIGVVDQLLRKRRPQRLSSVGALLDSLLNILPRAQWPTRLMEPQLRTQGTHADSERPSVHGLPRTDLLDGREEASVVLLHIEVIEGDEQLLYPTAPAPALVDSLERWCHAAARCGAWVQRPDVRSARCFFGIYDLEAATDRKAFQAAKCVEVLRQLVQSHYKETREQWLLRGGLVARHFKREDIEGAATLEDKDADEAYWLAREAEPDELMADTDAAFALHALCDIEPTGDLVIPPDERLVRCWRVTPRTA